MSPEAKVRGFRQPTMILSPNHLLLRTGHQRRAIATVTVAHRRTTHYADGHARSGTGERLQLGFFGSGL